MAYTVNKTNSSASPNSYTVTDGVVNTQTDLSFIGKSYAGYGETIAENFLHLLENFSNTSAPSTPIAGQLWWDSTNSRLKIHNGSAFVPAGSNAPYQSAAPTSMVSGDLWIDSDTEQLFIYNGSSSVLVGPPASSGTTNGFTYHAILDSTDVTQNITKWYNDGNLIAIISEDTFTPKVAISGFATVKIGVTLSTAISDVKFQGTATDSDALGGAAASTFLKSNANDTTTGTLGIVTDSGMTVGADSDLSLTVDSSGAIISNTISNSDITFKVNDGGVTTTLMTLDGSESKIGIATTTPSTTLQVAGTTTAQHVIPQTHNTYDLGASGNVFAKLWATTHTSSAADLAEVYDSDSEYEVGTVVIFGGDKEVTQSTISNDTRVAGVISDNPAYIMNDDSDGQVVGLVGKVSCKVHGMIAKGDLLTTCGEHPGCAKKATSPVLGSIIGKAMENKDSADESTILISVGRL